MKYRDYIENYMRETGQIARDIDRDSIHRAIEILKDVRDNRGRLFIIGIGGSASNASHAVNDFRKICRIETYTPTDNVGELTAWTNDNGFEVIFKHWLEGSFLRKEDAVMVLSVGGGSETTSRNITLALQYAKQKNAKTLGIVSRDGGMTKKLADVTILVPVVHEKRITPHAEGWQGVLWHLIVNALAAHHPATPYGWEPNKYRAVFIDRDGVVTRPIHRKDGEHPTAPWFMDEFEIFPGVPEALGLLKEKGFLTVLVTNQPDVAYGNMPEEEWLKIKEATENLPFDDFYACLHGRDEGCVCKKPKPGMLLAAADKWGIDLSRSFMVGDTDADTGAGNAAGVKTILVDTHYNKDISHDIRVPSFLEAANYIVGQK